MSERHDIKKPVPLMFDMIKGRANELIASTSDLNHWFSEQGSEFHEAIDLVEKALQLLEPFAYPMADHVRMTLDGVKCLRCGKEWSVEEIYFTGESRTISADDLAAKARRITAEHAACLPWIQIHDSLWTYVAELGHRGAQADQVVAQMIDSIKSILNDAKEGRL